MLMRYHQERQRRAVRTNQRVRHNGSMLSFLVPAVLLFGVVVILPVGVNAFYSFTDWNGVGNVFDFVGLKNFSRLADDPELLSAAAHTVIFTLVNTPIQIGVGLALALCLQQSGTYSNVLRITILMPIAISGVVLGFVGSLIFDPRAGLLAGLADVPGLSVLSQNWLGDPRLAMVTVIVMNVWQWAGLTMLIFLAGLVTQPAELHEAAIIDGASAPQRFWHVTVPLLAPAITINTVLTVIGGLKVFDIIFVLTKGGPAGATETIVSRVTRQASFGDYGYSAATNLVLTLAVIGVSFLLLRILRRKEVNL